MKALNETDDSKLGSMPFDENRSGFIIGEGAGVLILENLEDALKRGAKILGEVVGYGATTDAYHITAPHPEALGAYMAMKKAVDDALIGMMQSGEVAKIYDKWFVQPIPPKNTALDLPLSDALRELFKSPNDKPLEAYGS